MRSIVLTYIAMFLLGCGVGHTHEQIVEIEATEAHASINGEKASFIDVRTPEEFNSGHASTARNIPLDALSQHLGELNKDEPVYLICQTGNRSGKAADALAHAGFKKIYNITGGTSAWKAADLPVEK